MGRKLGAKQVPEERMNSILDMHAVGVKQVDIVRYYDMPKSTVSTIIKECRTTIYGGSSEKRAWKPKLSSRSIRKLLSYARKNRFKPLHVIATEYNTFSHE